MKHYTLFVGVDISSGDFSVNVKKADCKTIYVDQFSNHYEGFCKLISAFNSLNEEKAFKFQVAIESTGPHHKAFSPISAGEGHFRFRI